MGKSNSSKNKSAVPVKKPAKSRQADTGKFIDVDRSISIMAKRGGGAFSGENAVKRSFKRGLSVTVAEDGVIYKVHPNGTKTRVKRKQVFYRDSVTGKFYKK
ncbi:MAG: hypothetical protein ABIO55_07290 [Ginsengibacter sp.]